MKVEEIARIISGSPFPSKRSMTKARAVLTCLLDDPTMSRETRRYLEAFLQQNRSPVEGGTQAVKER